MAPSDVFGFENRPPTKKRVHLGHIRLPAPETPATSFTTHASLLRKGSSDVLDRTCVLCPVALGLRRRVRGALFKNKKLQKV